MSLTVKDLIGNHGFANETGNIGLENEIKTAYMGDLLSWVMGNAPDKNVWITIQGHTNVVAVAMLTGSSCIILAESSKPQEDMIEKACEEGIAVLSSDKSAYEIAKIFCGLEI